jgi:flagellin-like protein|tara:strand:+ start:9439 stop:9948 length:510 start_codon:yes stop_codon:yes gene_type:complete
MNKKIRNRGVSAVIGTVLMIALVILIIGVVWVSINSLIGEQIEGSEACFGNFGKVELDKRYTCHNSSSNEFQFSISVGDIVVDSMLVSVSSESGTKSFEISNTAMNNVRMYSQATYGGVVTVPGENSGFTYVTNITGIGIGTPDSVSVAPIINENQCSVSDTVLEINIC